MATLLRLSCHAMPHQDIQTPHFRTCLTPHPTHSPYTPIITLTVQKRPHSPSQLISRLPSQRSHILQIISRRNAKLPNKVLRRALKITILATRTNLIFVTTKVGIARDGRGALEPLEAPFGFGLRIGVELVAPEEFVAPDAFLCAEFVAGGCGCGVCGCVSLRTRCAGFVNVDVPTCGRLTEPNPPIFFGAAAGLLPPTCPKPSLPMPIPSRSTSPPFRSFDDVAPNPARGLMGVGLTISLDAVLANFVGALSSSASALGS